MGTFHILCLICFDLKAALKIKSILNIKKENRHMANEHMKRCSTSVFREQENNQENITTHPLERIKFKAPTPNANKGVQVGDSCIAGETEKTESLTILYLYHMIKQLFLGWLYPNEWKSVCMSEQKPAPYVYGSMSQMCINQDVLY